MPCNNSHISAWLGGCRKPESGDCKLVATHVRDMHMLEMFDMRKPTLFVSCVDNMHCSRALEWDEEPTSVSSGKVLNCSEFHFEFGNS